MIIGRQALSERTECASGWMLRRNECLVDVGESSDCAGITDSPVRFWLENEGRKAEGSDGGAGVALVAVNLANPGWICMFCGSSVHYCVGTVLNAESKAMLLM